MRLSAEVIMKRLLLSVILLMSLLMSMLSSGCDLGGKTVFLCNPDNLTGIEEVKIGNDRVTLYFNKDMATRTGKTPFGAMRKFFETGNADDYHAILLIDEKWLYEKKLENITVDLNYHTISFKLEDVKNTNITGFKIRSNKINFEEYGIEFNESKLSVMTSVEESSGWDRPLSGYYAKISTTYSQIYDKENGTWSDLEIKTSKSEMWS